MIRAVLLFIVGLVLLIKGGDWFVDSASMIARRFMLPELLIGATVVSIGTTLPEVMVSLESALSGHGEIAYGNAIGSVICNTALIAALTVAVHPAAVDVKTLRTPVAFFFGAAAVFSAAAYIGGYFSRPLGVLLLSGFTAYMYVSLREMTEEHAHALAPGAGAPAGEAQASEAAADKALRSTQAAALLTPAQRSAGTAGQSCGESAEDSPEAPTFSLMHDILFLILGAAVIAVGADLLVENGTLIASGLGVPESVIALTFVALGTSLPELVTAITSLMKGHGSLSLGNIIGANVFNLLLVCGVSVTAAPFGIPMGAKICGINSSLVLDIPVMFLVMAILTLPTLLHGRLVKLQGMLLLAIYAVFCIVQFAL